MMKTSWLLTLTIAGSMGMAFAQGPYSRDGYGNPRYNNRGYNTERYRDYDRDSYGGGYRFNLVDRVMNDLSRASGYGWMDNHNRKHIDHAQRDLDRFREKWSRGRFDRGRLDSAISNLQHVVNSNRIEPRSRDRLARDLYDLRNFRTRGAYPGARPY
jgi:hypothetical protein